MKLPPTIAEPVSDEQRRRLARWIAEWNVLQGEETDTDAEEAPFQAAASTGGPSETVCEDSPLRAGDVRLLKPLSRESWRRPVFLVVLSEEQADPVFVAPFSPVAEPAVPGELLVRGLAPGIQVLCLWNASRMPEGALQDSWLVSRLSAVQLARALAVYAHVAEDASIPSDVAPDVGPPLVHPMDPRHEYLARERTRMRNLVRESAQKWRASEAAGAGTPLYLHRPHSAMLLAAEAREPFGAHVTRYRVPGFDLYVTLTRTEAGSTIAGVRDSKGALVGTLDGATLRLADGRTSPPILHGWCELPFGSDKAQLTLLLTDGRSLPLEQN